MATNKKTYFPIAAFAIAFLLFSPAAMLAADRSVRAYIEASQSRVAPNSEIVAKVYIDSPSPANAIDIRLEYPKELLKPIAFNDSGSIVDLWQKKEWQGADGVISFTGGMLQPFSGQGGFIGELRWQVLKEGLAEIAFASVDVYGADGQGTKMSVAASPAEIAINGEASLFYTPQKDDTVPPVFEALQDFKNPADGNYLVAFEVKDSGSGVKAVTMRAMKWFAFGDWQQVTSPAALLHGAWKYQIAATDNSDNSSVKTLYYLPELINKILLLVLVLLLMGAFGGMLAKAIHTQKSKRQHF